MRFVADQHMVLGVDPKADWETIQSVYSKLAQKFHASNRETGDPEKFKTNLDRIMQNCSRFLDFDKIDVLMTSEYRFGGWTDLDRGKIGVREE